MSSFDVSMEPMLEMFIFESNTLLEQLDDLMLEAEKSKHLDEDSINEIFRIMHTIKGSAAMMGLEVISTLAHRVEDMFFLIRKDPDLLSGSGEVVYDLVLQVSDFLKNEIELVQGGNYTASDATALILQLTRQTEAMDGGGAAAPAAPAAGKVSARAAAAAQGEQLHQVRVFFEEGVQMENIRAFMLITQLTPLCSVLESVPSHPENDASTSEEIIKNGLLLRFAADLPQEVFDQIEKAVNIHYYEVIEENRQQTAEAKQANAAAAAQSGAGGQNNTGGGQHAVKQSLISVNQARLDRLLDLVGEIVISESMLEGSPDLEGLELEHFSKSARHLSKLTLELQDVVMSLRMVPISGVFKKMGRLVRDMSRGLGKEVELETVGDDTEVDKTVSDTLGDPLMHMIRNAMDHAIEPPEERIAAGKPPEGRVTLAAKSTGGTIVITITDDGRGLNPEVILNKARKNGLLTKPENEYSEAEIFSMIMLPGFSTKEQVTEYSGRGVGMDVVKSNLETVHGTITVESQQGKGTRFTIRIPLTLAIIDGMKLKVGDDVFTLPITAIKHSFKLSEETRIVTDTDGNEMALVRGECYPIIRLHKIFDLTPEFTQLTDGMGVLVENDDRKACLFVDRLLGKQQVVVKPLPPFLSRYNVKSLGLNGCTILGDGSISIILSAKSILQLY